MPRPASWLDTLKARSSAREGGPPYQWSLPDAPGVPAVVYLDPNGSDSDPGVAGSPKQTLAAALAALPPGGGVVDCTPYAAFAFSADDSFSLDVSKVRVRGFATTFNWSAAPTAGYALHLYSSVTYPTGFMDWGIALEGISLRGDLYSPLAGDGILIGDATYLNNADITVAAGGVEGFANLIHLISNGYRCHFVGFNLRGAPNAVYAETGITNSGEDMTFHACTVEGSINVAQGEWHFYGCALDNAEIVADGGSTVIAVHGGHMENPAAASANRYASVTNNATVTIEDATMVVNEPTGGDFTMAPFYSDSTNTWGGVVLIGCQLPDLGAAAWFTPEVTDGDRVLVGGSGRAAAHGCTYINASYGNGYALSSAANGLANPGFESGTLAGWTVYGSQTSDATAASSLFHTGGYSAQLAPAAGVNVGIYQNVPVRPGETVYGQAWYDLTTLGAGSSATITFSWLDATGASLGDLVQLAVPAVTTDWAVFAASGPAPAGAASAQVSAFCNNGSGNGVQLNVDDLLLSVG